MKKLFYCLVLITYVGIISCGSGDDPSCNDGILNGTETSIDCGGDCFSCPTCDDGIQNGSETGIDCGGACMSCPTCDDGMQNGNETGIDCGGDCEDCPDKATLLLGSWKVETFVGLGGTDLIGANREELYFEFLDNGDMPTFSHFANGVNAIGNREYTLGENFDMSFFFDGPEQVMMNCVFSNNNNSLTLTGEWIGQAANATLTRVTSNLCNGVECNDGTCYYGYCVCNNGSSSDNCLGVGDTGEAGGVIFYDKGSYSDGWRYLEATISDQSEGTKWGAPIDEFIGNTSTVIGSGKENTDLIFDANVSVGSAVSLVYSLDVGGKTDWFLPSRDELVNLYENKNIVGQFANGIYWTSTEAATGSAWVVSFINGVTDSGAPKQFDFRVRAIRRF